ncbi:hypothetical protein [Actinomadura sp. 9N407]|uniref:hypothetical protein n=1 Tax=Actinomadura sp. 9N407 TaxID=3375154 RepID=UPI00378E6D8A
MTDDEVGEHRVLYVDPDWLDDPDAYDGPEVDTDDQPDFASGIHAIAATSDLRRFALTTESQGNTESGRMCQAVGFQRAPPAAVRRHRSRSPLAHPSR